MRIGFLFISLSMLSAPCLAETTIENGVRVHRPPTAGKVPAAGLATVASVGLDRTYGVRPSCSSMDWRLSVSRETWQERCGEIGYMRWYDRWIYR